MGNFRNQWSSYNIREDSIIKVKGLEFRGCKIVDKDEFPVLKARAFDDTIFRVSGIFKLIYPRILKTCI